MIITLAIVAAVAVIIVLAGIGRVLAVKPQARVFVYDQYSDARLNSHLHNSK